MPSPSIIVDPSSDLNGVELAQIARQLPFPDFVKSAGLEETMRPRQVAVTAYADPVRRKYPCHSRAATWLSAAYFHEKAAEYHPKDQKRIRERLERFVAYHGIQPEYDTIVKAAASRKEHVLPESSYAFVSASADGQKKYYYPLDSAENIEKAASWLVLEREKIPFQVRAQAAERILEKTAARNIPLPRDAVDFLEKQAGYGVPDPLKLSTSLRYRAELAREPQQREALTKLAETVSSTPKILMDRELLLKLAETIEVSDHAIGLAGKYSQLLPSPEDTVFAVSLTKAASDRREVCALQTGSIYTKDQFAKLARESVESLLGPDFANEICTGLQVDAEKVAEIAPTLPRPDAELLEALLEEAGQYPQIKRAAETASPQAIEAVMEELADLY